MIEDTSFVVGVIRGGDVAVERLDQIESEWRPETIASITVLDLYEGVMRSSAPEEPTRDVLAVLDSKHVVDADAAVVRRAGKLSGTLYDRGDPIDREDCIVAATALLTDEPVVTRTTDQCERIDDLDSIDSIRSIPTTLRDPVHVPYSDQYDTSSKTTSGM